MNDPIGPDVPIANFVLESNKFTADGVSWRQYMPDAGLERSVFRINQLSKVEATALGQVQVADPRGKTVLGWGEFPAYVPSHIPPLTLRPDEPPLRHAVIEGWPRANEREKQIELAQRLASKAKPVRLT